MTQKIIACVQARFSSNRLPGKVLKPLCGRPMIGYLLESLKQVAALDEIVLTTSNEISDDPVAAFGEQFGVQVFRGSLDDVAVRVLSAAHAFQADGVVRLSGDSPLLDYRLVDKAITLFRDNKVDLVTNVAKRTFPKGQSVEVISVNVLDYVFEKTKTTKHEREHVTPRFYKEGQNFNLLNFESGEPLGALQLSVDTLEEFMECEEIIEQMVSPHWEYDFRQLVNMKKRLEGMFHEKP